MTPLDVVVGLYVRVSRKGDREDERFHSPREQAEKAEALARAKGYTPGPVFQDIDVSGATPPDERPAMGALLDAIERGELGGIAAFSLDRLSREPSHGDALVKRVTRAGGVILTPDIPDAIDSPTGEFTFGMLLQVAKLYRSQAGARFASAKARATLAGIPVGPVPVGYRQRPDRRLELDPDTAPTVREVYERRAAGEGWTSLADLLGEATGRVWTRQGAASVVANPLYRTGRLEYGGVVSEWDAGTIVDAPLWHASQRASSRRPSRSGGKWLLTGLLRCEGCGNIMTPWTGARRRRQDPRRGRNGWVAVKNPARRYRCTTRACSAPASVDAPRIERFVALQSFLVGDELVTRSEAPDLRDLEEALATAERRLAQVEAPEAQDACGDRYLTVVGERRRERDEAAAALGEARSEADAPALDFRLRDVWEGMSPSDRREALSLFWKAIRVARKTAAGQHVTLVARGPHAEAEVVLPADARGGGES